MLAHPFPGPRRRKRFCRYTLALRVYGAPFWLWPTAALRLYGESFYVASLPFEPSRPISEAREQLGRFARQHVELLCEPPATDSHYGALAAMDVPMWHSRRSV
jgi:hypothetical protein